MPYLPTCQTTASFGAMSDKKMLPVIIIGCQRSGTTLLRTVLGRHPALLEHPDEPQYFYWLHQRFGNVITDIPTAVAYLSHHPYLPADLSRQQLETSFAPHRQMSLPAFTQQYLHIWGSDRLRRQRPLLKDPAWVYHPELVQTLFPGATIVHIIRDPRANVSSQINRWPHISVWEAAHAWRRALRHRPGWQQIFGHNYVEITYENFLQEPDRTLTSLCRALNIEFTPEMLTFEQESTVYTPDHQPLTVKRRTLDPSRLDQWRERLSASDIQLIEHVCGQEMVSLKYQPLNPPAAQGQLFRRQLKERSAYAVKKTGKRIKGYGRKLGWKLGIGTLPLPQN